MPQIYTRTGDDGTTGLLYGKRVRKDHPTIEANGAVDEAQAAIGVARAETDRGSELDQMLIGLERDLWVLMAELATAREDRPKLEVRKTLVTKDMVEALEGQIDDLKERTEVSAEFVVPGQDRLSALLDQARTVVRRAERLVVTANRDEAASEDDGESGAPPGSYVAQYLNRLSDLIWIAARWQEGEHELAKKRP
jgi:cob(I)alamin adenosyltransferase